jgi:sodium-independent sulfate anion transporter 11
MSSVNQLDVTAINGLVDLRAALNQHTAPETCEIYFANMHCRQARKALRLSGFAGPVQSDNPREWSPAYTVALRRKTSEASRVSSELQVRIADEEQGSGPRQPAQEVAADQRRSELAGTSVALTSVDSPFIHLDLYDAVRAAVRRQDPCIKTTINTKTVV